MNLFRALRADEIDCRISQIKENNDGDPIGLTLLLYKDARCDQNILDETVGAMNWQREHTRDNRNCIVKLWDAEKAQWIGKEDTGTESNTEREKGLASDSFKRACFNWGIGRELYTAPFIWIGTDGCEIKKDKRGKWVCYDNFTVAMIQYEDGVISGLKIKNNARKFNRVVFSWGNTEEKPVQPDNEPNEDDSFPKANNTVPSVPPTNDVKSLIERELETMMVAYGFPNQKATLTKFTEWRNALMESGVLPKTKKITSVDEARATFDAIYKNFAPSEGESA